MRIAQSNIPVFLAGLPGFGDSTEGQDTFLDSLLMSIMTAESGRDDGVQDAVSKRHSVTVDGLAPEIAREVREKIGFSKRVTDENFPVKCWEIESFFGISPALSDMVVAKIQVAQVATVLLPQADAADAAEDEGDYVLAAFLDDQIAAAVEHYAEQLRAGMVKI